MHFLSQIVNMYSILKNAKLNEKSESKVHSNTSEFISEHEIVLKIQGFYASLYKESRDFMKQKSVKWINTIKLLLFCAVFSIKDVSEDVEKPSKI